MVKNNWLIFLIMAVLFIGFQTPKTLALADEIKIIMPQATAGNIYVQEIPVEKNNEIKFISKNIPNFLKLYENHIYGRIPQNIQEKIQFNLTSKSLKKESQIDITIPIKKLLPELEEIIYYNTRIGYKIDGKIITNSKIKKMEKDVKDFLENTAKPLGITPRHTQIPNNLNNEEKASYISNLLNITQIQKNYENSDKGDEAKTQLVQSLKDHQQNSNLLYLTFKVRELENK